MIPEQRFYEKLHGKNSLKHSPSGILYYLFHRLQKFELYREDAVYNLLPGGNTLLDIGCGDGNVIFKSLTKYKKAVGVDIATNRISRAVRKSQTWPKIKSKRVKFIQFNANLKWPWSAETFDAVTLIATLEHLFNPEDVISQAYQVLKNEGVLIVEVPNVVFLPNRLKIMFGKLPITAPGDPGWDGGHLHYFTVESLSDLLKTHGFQIKAITCSGIWVNYRSWWIAMLGGDIIIKAQKII